jgi:hypothetical protein
MWPRLDCAAVDTRPRCSPRRQGSALAGDHHEPVPLGHPRVPIRAPPQRGSQIHARLSAAATASHAGDRVGLTSWSPPPGLPRLASSYRAPRVTQGTGGPRCHSEAIAADSSSSPLPRSRPPEPGFTSMLGRGEERSPVVAAEPYPAQSLMPSPGSGVVARLGIDLADLIEADRPHAAGSPARLAVDALMTGSTATRQTRRLPPDLSSYGPAAMSPRLDCAAVGTRRRCSRLQRGSGPSGDQAGLPWPLGSRRASS